ncbi:MAG TPA: hypothetical protein VJN70_20000 [Gemmatimonadaceae bacterium]|nr:hypothetical protein [Gemmatimonadaceae bacterium]
MRALHAPAVTRARRLNKVEHEAERGILDLFAQKEPAILDVSRALDPRIGDMQIDGIACRQ